MVVMPKYGHTGRNARLVLRYKIALETLGDYSKISQEIV